MQIAPKQTVQCYSDVGGKSIAEGVHKIVGMSRKTNICYTKLIYYLYLFSQVSNFNQRKLH